MERTIEVTGLQLIFLCKGAGPGSVGAALEQFVGIAVTDLFRFSRSSVPRAATISEAGSLGGPEPSPKERHEEGGGGVMKSKMRPMLQ